MIKQIVVIYVSLALLAICLAQTTMETPQECVPDSPNYNATICSEKCTNELYKNQSFCLRNATTNAPTTVNPDTQTSQTPEVTPSVTTTSEQTTTVVQNVNVSNETNSNNTSSSSSGILVHSSKVFTGSCFLLLYFVL